MLTVSILQPKQPPVFPLAAWDLPQAPPHFVQSIQPKHLALCATFLALPLEAILTAWTLIPLSLTN